MINRLSNKCLSSIKQTENSFFGVDVEEEFLDLKSDAKISINEGVLHIKKVEVEDEGLYECMTEDLLSVQRLRLQLDGLDSQKDDTTRISTGVVESFETGSETKEIESTNTNSLDESFPAASTPVASTLVNFVDSLKTTTLESSSESKDLYDGSTTLEATLIETESSTHQSTLSVAVEVSNENDLGTKTSAIDQTIITGSDFSSETQKTEFENQDVITYSAEVMTTHQTSPDNESSEQQFTIQEAITETESFSNQTLEWNSTSSTENENFATTWPLNLQELSSTPSTISESTSQFETTEIIEEITTPQIISDQSTLSATKEITNKHEVNLSTETSTIDQSNACDCNGHSEKCFTNGICIVININCINFFIYLFKIFLFFYSKQCQHK